MHRSVLPLALVLLPAWTPAPGQERRPAPVGPELRRAEKQIREAFGEEYAARGWSARIALAKKLLESGLATQNDSAARFVLLREARDIAALALDLDTAFAAAGKLADLFDVALDDMRAAAVASAKKAASRPEEASALAAALLGHAEESFKKSDHESAARWAREAEQIARSARDQALAARAAELRKEHEGARAAELKLSVCPEDPEANLVYGRFLCCLMDDWPTGLQLLARGADPLLRDLARMDLAGPSTVEAQIEMADGWFELATKDGAPDRRRFLSRARTWYETAAKGASGIVKARIERRMEEIQRWITTAVDLLKLIDLKLDVIVGAWKLEGGALISPSMGQIRIPYAPPAEYDLEMVVRKNPPHVLKIGLAAGEVRFEVALDNLSATLSGIFMVDGKPAQLNETAFRERAFTSDKPARVLVSVRRMGVSATVEGRKVVDWRGDLRRLSLHEWWKAGDRSTLLLGSNSGPYVVERMVLITAAGSGRRLR